MVWQLSIQNGYLSSTQDDPSMTFQYPVDIARDLVTMASQFPQNSMEVHGLGLVCVLFVDLVFANYSRLRNFSMLLAH